MPVPNSLPVSLSSVIAEFGGGSNAPRNLAAYRAGAGYTPAGSKGGSAAIPTPNGAIPSAFPVNLGAFPGSKKELSITQYWPYKDYFHRNLYYHSSNPPQTVANNDDPTRHWGSDFGNAGYKNNGCLWQQKNFNNVNNGNLPDSGQCTVFYLNNGSAASFANTMSGGTGLSARVRDPAGQIMHLSPVATGKINFTTAAGTGTGSETALSWASYNCSIKKIEQLFTAMVDYGSSGAWDEVIILPGLRKIKEYAVARDNTGYDIKPANPINPDEVVFGMTYDGGGDYEIQFQNQTFPNWLRQCGWWYVNARFDIEANVGTVPVTLTTQVPQDYSPSNVWVVVNENTAGGYATGVNPVWGALSISVTNSGTSSFTMRRNGGITATINGVAVDLPDYVTCPENWYMGGTGTSMPGDNYWVRVTPNGSSNMASGPTGWVQMSGDLTWTWSGNNTSCIVNVDIATDASGSNSKYLGYVIMGTMASSGGGGGGGCVEVTSFLADHSRAGDVKVGQVLHLADPETLEPGTGEVSYSEQKVMPGWKIETSGGVWLRCSDTAPIPTRDNGYKVPSELKGQFVAVRRDSIDGPVVTWEEVLHAYSVGDILVQHITVGDKNFWAGGDCNGFILHHNLKNQDQFENMAN